MFFFASALVKFFLKFFTNTVDWGLKNDNVLPIFKGKKKEYGTKLQ